jgi:hypothetical protein
MGIKSGLSYWREEYRFTELENKAAKKVLDNGELPKLYYLQNIITKKLPEKN